MAGQQPKLGNKTSEGTGPVYWDLDRLIETRLLIQASSGGGKSYACRGLLEQTHGRVQQIVLDPDGEYYTLREQHDYLLVGKGGDCPATVEGARLLAHRLLELGVSAIIDLYELKKPERVQFVKRFLEAMVDAPKDLWHAVLVVLDEAHVFCPQKGYADSAGAVVDMASRGRKRGFCLVPVTQRIAKLDKDVAAECHNKLIGLTTYADDRQRAGDDLGMTTKKEQRALIDLEPGEFFAFGPAISREVLKLKTVTCKTSHPKVGKRAAPRPPAPATIQKLMAQLADLPKEAEEEAKTAAELRAKLRQVESELRAAQRSAQPAQKTAQADEKALAAARRQGQRDILAVLPGKARKYFDRTVEAIVTIDRGLQAAHAATNDLRLAMNAAESIAANPPYAGVAPGNGTVAMPTAAPTVPRVAAPTPSAPIEGLDGPETRILNALAWLKAHGSPEPSNVAVALLAGYSANGGAYTNPRGRLNKKGLLAYLPGGRMRLTDEGDAVAVAPADALTNKAMHERVQGVIDGPMWRILRPLLEAYPSSMTMEDLAAAAVDEQGKPYSPNGGAFTNPRGRLKTLGLIDYPQKGHAAAKDILFPER